MKGGSSSQKLSRVAPGWLKYHTDSHGGLYGGDTGENRSKSKTSVLGCFWLFLAVFGLKPEVFNFEPFSLVSTSYSPPWLFVWHFNHPGATRDNFQDRYDHLTSPIEADYGPKTAFFRHLGGDPFSTWPMGHFQGNGLKQKIARQKFSFST